MTNNCFHHRGRLFARLLLICVCGISSSQHLSATDYFLTIGGGYEPEGNQASLEENVIFFQRVLTEKHPGPRRHDVYFADGQDPIADLQVLIEKPAKSVTPATDLLARLHRRADEADVTYRNHRVTGIAGPLEPGLIRADLESLARATRAGDRLIIYVTAHGSEGPEEDEFNTTIDCWNERQISAREFLGWLNKIPPNIPVVMVMAQCYCGGFSHTVFRELDPSKGMAPYLRAGFFAQQHDLPAAGCRPDIEHDEEFSSYFWGALAGRSRNGVPITGCDVDGNGVVSFAEAYAYAVIAGETIDIPLRTSEVVLRKFSRLKAAEGDDAAEGVKTNLEGTDQNRPGAKPGLSTMSGSLQTFVDRGGPVSGRIVTQLSKTLGFTLQDDVAAVISAYDKHRRAEPGRGRRQRSGRRDLLREVSEKWPELGDRDEWRKSALLKTENQEKLLAELKQLPSWKTYEERVKQREAASKDAERHELRAVKFQRLMNALETIVLEKNLALFASPEIVGHYRQMIGLEEMTLRGK